jgi:uroporphyrinogen decarboxylase
MIEIGLDVLNPLQPMAMDPFDTKKRYGKRLALFGGLCVQQVMPYGSVEDVRSAVTKLVAELGQGGGYILAPAHHIQSDTSLDNIKALYESALA